MRQLRDFIDGHFEDERARQTIGSRRGNAVFLRNPNLEGFAAADRGKDGFPAGEEVVDRGMERL